MFNSLAVTTMLPAIDMERARAFYEGKLGLSNGVHRPDGQWVYRFGGTSLALMPKPEGTKADHTVLSFAVDDIAASISDLERAGVVFEDYDLPDFKTVDHVLTMGDTQCAWFKDTEGNFLCLHQDVDKR